jgi:hypothetical protein
MNRSRRLVFTAAAVSVLGIGFAFSTRLTSTARAAVGPVPPEALALPADSAMVMGFDVRALTGSQFYAKFGQENEPGRVEALAEIERRTGLNPERDIDSVVIAVQSKDVKEGAEGESRHRDGGLVFVTGRFDAARLESSIPEAGKVQKERRDGVTIYRGEGVKSHGSVALLDAGILVAGETGAVDTFLANRASGHGIRDSRELVSLLEKIEPGSTFWAVGGASVLNRVAGAAGPVANLPAIKQVVAYGHLDPEVGVTATAEAADAKSANKIADVLRGFSAMLSLQASQKAELAQIADSISVATEDDKVHVKATFTHELLDSLKKSGESAVHSRKRARKAAAEELDLQ